MGGIYLSVGIKVETNSNVFLVCLHNLAKEVELCGNVKSFFFLCKHRNSQTGVLSGNHATFVLFA